MISVSPKSEFIQRKDAASFADLINHPLMQEAIRAALLQFALDQARADSWENAARHHHELQGAKNFVAYLNNLIETESPPVKPKNENLEWLTRSQLQKKSAQAAQKQP